MEIPGYRDLEEIGRGRASVVYRAVQEEPGRTVAIKVLSVGAVEERLRRRFERECAATSRVSGHPNIVAVLDNGYTNDTSPYITTAYYEHGSLGDRVTGQGPMSVDEVLRVGVKIAGALEAVHAVEILHRDIKPSNLLEAADGEPALTGFGISAIDPAQQAMTMAQSFAPVHAPPEVILGQPATAAGDTYQLASTLYFLLAGRAPFETGTDDGLFAMLERIQSAEVPDIDRADVPPVVVDALRVGLAKQPAGRDPSSAAFGERLRAVQAHLGMTPTEAVTTLPGAAAPAATPPAAPAAPVAPAAPAAPVAPPAPPVAPVAPAATAPVAPAPPAPPTPPAPPPATPAAVPVSAKPSPAPTPVPPRGPVVPVPPPDAPPVAAPAPPPLPTAPLPPVPPPVAPPVAPPAPSAVPPQPVPAFAPTPAPPAQPQRDEDRSGLRRVIALVVAAIVIIAIIAVAVLILR